MLARPRKTREFTGPTPHSVAIEERTQTTRPRDYLIRERHRNEQQRQVAIDQKVAQEAFDLKNEWEKQTDRQFKRQNIQRRIASKLFEHEIAVEERRNRLCILLAQEEEDNLAELEEHLGGETQTERLAKMRQRAKALARKREDERLKIVEEKSEQRWRGECEELRAVLSRRHQDQVCAARKHQIETKIAIKKDLAAEDALYAKLWKQDEQIKAAREEQEATEVIQRNKEALGVLSAQVSAKQDQRAAGIKEIEHEAELLKEEQNLRIKELEIEQKELSKRQKNYRVELSNHRIQREQRENMQKQAEIELEHKILNEASRALDDEATFTAELRDQRILYENDYRQYIAEQRKEEEEREAEFDRLYMEDQKREWQLRDKKQRAQNEARANLMKSVYRTRDNQLADKEAARRAGIEADKEERNRILADVDNFRQTEAERLSGISNRNRSFQADLVGQMQQLDEKRGAESKEAQAEYEADISKERAYQERIKRAIQHY